MAPATDDAAKKRAALEEAFGERRGRFTITRTNITKLVEYFMTTNEKSVAELPLDVSGLLDDDWKVEWCEYAEDAGVAPKAEIGNLLRWIACSPGSAGRSINGENGLDGLNTSVRNLSAFGPARPRHASWTPRKAGETVAPRPSTLCGPHLQTPF